jgi:hypothetical protein
MRYRRGMWAARPTLLSKFFGKVPFVPAPIELVHGLVRGRAPNPDGAPPASAGRISSVPPGNHAGNLENKDTQVVDGTKGVHGMIPKEILKKK